MSLPEQNPRDWCKVVAIDRIRKVRMNAELRDTDGSIIDIQDTVENLAEYVLDKMKDEEANTIQRQVFPVMAHAAVTTLTQLVGQQTAGLLMSQELFRSTITSSMMISFLLMQFIKKNDIKIYTSEESITDEEMASYDRVNAATSVTTLAATLGADPKEIIRELIKQGRLTKEDLKALGVEDLAVEETSGSN